MKAKEYHGARARASRWCRRLRDARNAGAGRRRDASISQEAAGIFVASTLCCIEHVAPHAIPTPYHPHYPTPLRNPGCFSVNDLLRNVMGELTARAPHWLEKGAAAFTAEDLVAVGRAVESKSVGELEHGERRRRGGQGCARQLCAQLSAGSGLAADCWREAHAPCLPTAAPPPAGGALFLLNAQSNTSMLDFVNNRCGWLDGSGGRPAAVL